MLVQISKYRANKETYSAIRIDENGATIHNKKKLSIIMPRHLKGAVQIGSIWDVEGSILQHQYAVGGFTVYEEQIVANEAKFVKPNTALIETWLRKNIDGVGTVKAQRIARIERLNEIIEAGDPDDVLKLHPTSRRQLLEKFPRDGYAEAIDWLSRRELPVKIANSISAVWREKTVEILEDNPFRLMQFNVSFKLCGKVASEFGITQTDDRFRAALGYAIIRDYTHKSSSTYMPRNAYNDKLNNIKKSIKNSSDEIQLAAKQELVCYLENVDGYQLEGHYLLEALTGMKLRDAFLRKDGDLSNLATWETSVTEQEIEYHLNEFEKSQTFPLTKEQRQAVVSACKWKVMSISGGAGTGKTTVLKAILSVLSAISLDTPVYQVALSGRASQRMYEATGQEASTIAKFVIDQKNLPDSKRSDHCIVVIDEASMVDLFSMYSLLEQLPLASRFIFVGDIDQLPPVGGGLVFHELMKSEFPSVTLTQVKRQGKNSSIHRLATAIRTEEKEIKIRGYHYHTTADCTLSPHTSDKEIINLYNDLGGAENCVILTAMQKGDLGVLSLNRVLQRSINFTYERPIIRTKTETHKVPYMSSKGYLFCHNDPIMINKNDYKIGIRNGDLGFIETVYNRTKDGVFGVLNIDGRQIDITEQLLEKMDLGYAITIHKSQGSQWNNVILILDDDAHRMLDKTLLYTAVTRAQKKLVICCKDQQLIQDSVNKGSIAHNRNTNLLEHLNKDY